MKKWMVWLSLTALVLTFGAMRPGVVWAAEGEVAAPAEEEETTASGARLMTGIIAAVDAGAGTLTVQRRRAGTATLTVTPETVILIGDEPGTLADLKTNTRAAISYREADGKLTARWIRDALTVRIREAESLGVRGVITALNVDAGTLTVRTAFEKVRELKLVREGRYVSRIMKQGQAADLKAFQVNDKVMVSIRRTSGATLYLKGLADEPSFVAFLRDRCVEGSFRSVEVEAGRLVVAPAEGDPVTVGFSRRTKFYLGGQEAKEPTFQADQAIVVL
jgi:hypothetical protein